jgi:hypothetical protein
MFVCSVLPPWMTEWANRFYHLIGYTPSGLPLDDVTLLTQATVKDFMKVFMKRKRLLPWLEIGFLEPIYTYHAVPLPRSRLIYTYYAAPIPFPFHDPATNLPRPCHSPMLIHTYHAVPPPFPCRNPTATLPWPWEVAFRTAYSWHGWRTAWYVWIRLYSPTRGGLTLPATISWPSY